MARRDGQASLDYLLLIGGAILLAVIVIALVTVIGPTLSQTTQTNAGQASALSDPRALNCGDGMCSLRESCSTCVADCGQCGA
jgi:uncharacterized protein (UPF0333 family)